MTRSNTFRLSFGVKLEKLVKDLEKHFRFELFSVFRPMNVIGNYGVINIAKLAYFLRDLWISASCFLSAGGKYTLCYRLIRNLPDETGYNLRQTGFLKNIWITCHIFVHCYCFQHTQHV